MLLNQLEDANHPIPNVYAPQQSLHDSFATPAPLLFPTGVTPSTLVPSSSKQNDLPTVADVDETGELSPQSGDPMPQSGQT